MKVNDSELNFNVEEHLYNEMINLLKKKFDAQFDKERLKILKEAPLASVNSDNTPYDKEVDCWLNLTGLFFTTARRLFSKYNLTAKQQFVFLEKGIKDGYLECMSFNHETLLTNDVLKCANFELTEMFLNNYNWNLVLDILTAKRDIELLKKIRCTECYSRGEGYTPRKLAEHMDLPSDVDYSKEVRNNAVINIFNKFFDDACIYEKWPTKIRRLVADKSFGYLIDHPVIRMNQSNIISLAKSLYEWGAGFNEPTYTRAVEFYEVIKKRIAENNLTLYDYQNSTLRNMKTNHIGEIDFSIPAPYTNHVLEQFNNPPKNDDILEEIVLKKVIKFNPENERHIDFRR